MFDRKAHWEEIYQTRSPLDVSWYQEHPKLSLALIRSAGLAKDAAIIDVGGGSSRLAKYLLDAGFQRIAMLDIASRSLAYAKEDLAERAGAVEWLVGDVLEFAPPHPFALWHDRAVFHFFSEAAERRRYVDAIKKALMPHGHVIMAAFAVGGAKECSGLPVVQYDADKLSAELGPDFELLRHELETHHTPWGAEQKFIYCLFQRKPGR